MNTRLYKTLLYLNENIPYYENQIDLQLDNQCILEKAIKMLPILDKKDIMNNYISFINKQYKEYNFQQIFEHNKTSMYDYLFKVNGISIYLEFTSGSTGEPFFSLKSQNDRMMLSKNLWNLRRRIDDIIPSRFFRFMHLGLNTFNPFPFEWSDDNEQSIEHQLTYLQNQPYTWWHAYPSILHTYMNFMVHHPKSFPYLEFIESNGAYISEEEKKEVEEKFKCKVINNYGCREVWNIAYGCEYGNMHINTDNVFVELIDEDGSVITEANKPGQVVITSLIQKFMPLIRYRLGDWGFFVDNKCECNNKEPILYILPGRNIIKNTTIYGNAHFSCVIKFLIQEHNICDFAAFNIIQTQEDLFEVYVTDFEGNSHDMEEKFIEISDSKLKSNQKYYYKFIYGKSKVGKSLFLSL